MAGSHSLTWYAGATPIAYDRSDVVQRRAIGTGVNPTVDLIRQRSSGAVQDGDVLGAVRAQYNDGSGEVTGGKVLWIRGASSTTTALLSGTNTGGAEFSLCVALNGANSVDPSAPNLFALGQVAAWSNIYSQNALTVTSDERMKDMLGPPPEALLDALWDAMPTLIQDYRFTGRTRIHTGVGAQTLLALFASVGDDPFERGILCADPWMEPVEVEYEAEEPLYEDRTEVEITTTVDQWGGAVAVETPVTRQIEVWHDLPLFDADGNLKNARDAEPASAIVLDPAGGLRFGDWPVSRVPVAEDMVEGERGVVKIIPERPAVPATYRVQAINVVTKTRTEMRQKVDDDGVPMERLSVRYEPLFALMIAAMRAA
jgi:hypothetical protein